MRNMIKLSYSIYIFLFLFQILNVPIFSFYGKYSIMYTIFLILIYLKFFKGKIETSKKTAILDLFLILLLIFFNGFRSLSNMGVLIKMICLVLIIICNYYLSIKYDLSYSLLKISFYLPSFFILWRFVESGCPLSVYSKLNLLFGAEWNQRFRLSFGTYHPNAIGNLACCVILISFILLSQLTLKEFKNKVIILLIIVLDLVNFTVLLSTDSRTSILTILIFLLVFSFLQITKINNRNLRLILRIFIATIGTFIIVITQFNNIEELFISSYRFENFNKNLPYLKTPFKVFMGLGVIDAQDFGLSTTGLGNTFYVDNYFLYILLTQGVVGLFLIFHLIYNLFRKFAYYCKNIYDIEAILILSIFVAHLFSAIGETSFLYYTFPSNIIYFTIYFCFLGNRIKN